VGRRAAGGRGGCRPVSSVWSTLLPLALASMAVPVQRTLTIHLVPTSPLRASVSSGTCEPAPVGLGIPRLTVARAAMGG